MKRTSFRDLVEKLQKFEQNRFPIVDGTGGMSYVSNVFDAFVGPDLSERSDLSTTANPSVVLVSAAGAVGKTTLAKELASRTRAPLWDLAAAEPIGQNSVTGTLAKSFGPGAYSNLHSAFASGTGLLLIDSLDEARIKCQESGFLAFLGDLAAYASSNDVATPRIILFGRTNICETTWLALQDRNVSVAVFNIESFNPEQAKIYIERRLATSAAGERVRAHRKPFDEARDTIFARLGAAVGRDNEGAAQFLGYAPVLDAVAVLLAQEPNFAVLKQKLDAQESQSGGAGHMAALRYVVDLILRREQEKLCSHMKNVLEESAGLSGWANWSQLYSIDEQCVRLLGAVFGEAVTASAPMPPAVRDRYEEQLGSWLPEHPFLGDGRKPANAVFESFLMCRALKEDLGGFQASAERRLAALDYKPSRLLADFYLHELTYPVPAQHVGILYDALRNGETDRMRVALTIDGLDPEDVDDPSLPIDAEAEFILEGDAEVSIPFEIFFRPGSALSFTRGLRNAMIIVPIPVSLGAGAGEVEIAAPVLLRSSTLELLSESLVVTRSAGVSEGSDNAVVLLEPLRYEGLISRKLLVHTDFFVRWPGANTFPWVDYQLDRDDEDIGSEQLRLAFRRFRRIVMTLRSHSKGQLARYKGKVEHQRVLKGEMGERLLERLLADGILKLDDMMYTWDPERAGALVGISWHHLREGRTSPTLVEYLKHFLESTT